jgi:hypothetical protein
MDFTVLSARKIKVLKALLRAYEPQLAQNTHELYLNNYAHWNYLQGLALAVELIEYVLSTEPPKGV